MNENGWFTKDMVIEWVQLAWQHQPGTLLGFPSLLVCDSYTGHTQQNRSGKEKKMDLAIILLDGITSILQSLNKYFKGWLSRED